MTTGRLLWGMTWRGGAWGLLVGTLGGTAYGAVFANVLLAAGLVSQMPFDWKPEYAVSAIGAVLFLALIGAVVGGIFGVPSGIVVGTMVGLAMGVLTRAVFYPPRGTRVFRWTLAITSALLTTIAAWMCFIAIMLFYANRNAASVGALMIVVAIPALIAGAAAALISRLLARWYEQHS
ncbi:MAG: hypothetical protein HY782_03915 [Chloroflexi bacterium]|nr:hypothetical protein [Chloroflexota bacterium]